MVYLNKTLEGCGVEIVVKFEIMELCCSVKDCIGWSMIVVVEEEGKIMSGKTTFVESTSGNIGIGLVFIVVVKGYKFMFMMLVLMSFE